MATKKKATKVNSSKVEKTKVSVPKNMKSKDAAKLKAIVNSDKKTLASKKDSKPITKTLVKKENKKAIVNSVSKVLPVVSAKKGKLSSIQVKVSKAVTKAETKKAPAKKSEPVKPAAPAKKVPAKKAPAKKSEPAKPAAPAKKAPAKKVEPAKPAAPAKKAPAKKSEPAKPAAPAKKAPTKKAETTKPVEPKKQEIPKNLVLPPIGIASSQTSSTVVVKPHKLTKGEIRELRKMLEKEYKQKQVLVESFRRQSLERTDEVNQIEDGSDANTRETELKHATQLENEMLAINAALRGLSEGTYGICPCGRRIRLERLKANPAATLCIECAKKRDADMSQY